VVRYRGAVLPIITLNDFLKFPKPKDTPPLETMCVIVVQKAGRSYGIEVDDILDVASLDANIDDSLRDRTGILGNIIYNEEVIVVVDILQIVHKESLRMGQRTDSSVQQELNITEYDAKRSKTRILFAEDTAFFRKHVGSVLKQAGYEVTSVNDGKEALDTLESSESGKFSIVLSDVEMPIMGGIELAKNVRLNERLKHLPLVALTTKYSEHHVKEGIQSGFTAYLEKMNPEQLIKQLDELTFKRKAS